MLLSGKYAKIDHFVSENEELLIQKVVCKLNGISSIKSFMSNMIVLSSEKYVKADHFRSENEECLM